ncbi:LuxR C-terminal-related transcriptional regulator [Bradyrhizobium centrosematis]|uniref:LuxR C-terminal-related transcriptional regulator n=1 Tax=Bradyrhizobium centrosematis TaxID=1300039 RepID=UPI00388FEBAB
MLDASARQGILKPIRLVIVDRQPIVLQGLKSVLGTQQDFDVVAASRDGTGCVEAIRSLTPDVALIADALPDLTAAEILAIVKAEKLSTRLVFFTETEVAPDLTAAIAAGACSAISKYVAPANMLHALRLMTKSGVSLEQRDLSPSRDDAKIEKLLELLTDRERQIARLVSEGLSNKEIARKLNVSQGTVKVHLYNIFQKLEITNRTVLATIALLQRTSAFGALALAFLAFAVADELKASEASDMFPDAEGPGHAGEHPGYEVWKKAILQRLIVSDSHEAPPFAERHVVAKASEVMDPAAAIEALRAAEQFMGAKPWKGYAPAGSITPSSAALLPQQMSDTRIESELFPQNQFPRFAANPTIHSGYGTFAALAGALIYALSESDAVAKSFDPAHASIDSTLASLGEMATTKLAAINQADKSAPDTLSHDLGLHSVSVTDASDIAQVGVQGHAGPDAAGLNLQRSAGVLDAGLDSSPAGSSRDQLIGGNVEDFAFRAPIASRSGPSDSVVDVAFGPGRLNLSAFGALAWLHLTAAAKSIPPHTLAWVYDAATNETIVYVNTTDRVLDVGDRALMEVHVQGIVSIAEADVGQPEGAAVAVTLEQLEQALVSAIATDEAGLTTGSPHLAEGSTGAAGVWSALALGEVGFQFAQVRTGFETSAKAGVFTSEPPDKTDLGTAASNGSVQGSSTALGQGASVPAIEKLSAKSEPMNAGDGAPSTQQNEWVPPDLPSAADTGAGNSGHASEPESKEPAPQLTDAGNGGGEGTEHQAPASKETRESAAEKPSTPVEHGNSEQGQHQDPANAQAADVIDVAGGSHAHHASEQGASKGAAGEVAETGATPQNGIGHDNDPQSPASINAAGAKADVKAGSDHGHSAHPSSADAQEADQNVVTADGGQHGHSPHAPDPDDHGDGNQHSPASDDPEAARAMEKGGGDGNLGQPADGNAQQAAYSGAAGSETAKSAEIAFTSGADHEAVFRFDGEVIPSPLAAAIAPEELKEPHVPPGQDKDAQMLLDMMLVAPDQHTAQHGDHGLHAGLVFHDWLI